MTATRTIPVATERPARRRATSLRRAARRRATAPSATAVAAHDRAWRLLALYALLPLFWLVVNATKTQRDLFSIVRPLVLGRLRAVGQHRADPDLRRRRLRAAGSATPCSTSCSAPAARRSSPTLGGLRASRSSTSRASARVFAIVHRRGRGARHRAGRADVPHVQPDGADEHPVGDHPAVADHARSGSTSSGSSRSTPIPTELLEAARIDGAGEFRTFFPSPPLLAPGFVTVLLFTIVATWNNYFLPLIMLKRLDLVPADARPQRVERAGRAPPAARPSSTS